MKAGWRSKIILLASASVFFSALNAMSETAHTPAVDQDYLIVPGKSCGKIFLGMSKDDVTKLLGAPTKKIAAVTAEEPEVWSYEAKDNWLHILFAGNRVAQIDFTSPSFKTEEGFATDLKKVEESKNSFALSQISGRFENQKYQYNRGGLSFYAIGAENGNDDRATKIGTVHRGSRPINEAFAVGDEPNNGWKPPKNTPDAPLFLHPLTPNSVSEKTLNGDYSFRQKTNDKGLVNAISVMHGKKIIEEQSCDKGSIIPLISDQQDNPICRDLDGDGVTDLALLTAEDKNPPSYLLRITPLQGEKLQNKYTGLFYGKKPVALPIVKTGQPGILATDDSYVYSFGDAINSPEPLIRVRWPGKSPFKLSIDEMKKPPLSREDMAALAEKVQKTAVSKDGVFRISHEFLQAVFDLIYSGRSQDAQKLVSEIWPSNEDGQWSGGPPIDRDEFWLEVTERLAESPFYPEIEKMNGDTTKWQAAFK